MSNMFDAKIALFHRHADSRDEALKMLAEEFMKSGVAKETFFDGILNREKVFPTGLTLNNCVSPSRIRIRNMSTGPRSVS